MCLRVWVLTCETEHSRSSGWSTSLLHHHTPDCHGTLDCAWSHSDTHTLSHPIMLCRLQLEPSDALMEALFIRFKTLLTTYTCTHTQRDVNTYSSRGKYHIHTQPVPKIQAFIKLQTTLNLYWVTVSNLAFLMSPEHITHILYRKCFQAPRTKAAASHAFFFS